MKYIKSFKLFENSNLKIEDIIKHGTKYELNDEGKYIVYGDVDISNFNITELPFSFKMVKGNFECNHGKFTTLKGFPEIIYGGLNLENNDLENLDYFPKKIRGSYINLSNNKLTNIIGMKDCYIETPSLVTINLKYNFINSLEGLPEDLYTLDISDNDIKDFKHLPYTLSSLYASGLHSLESIDGFRTDLNEFSTVYIFDSNIYDISIFKYIKNVGEYQQKCPAFYLYKLINLESDLIDIFIGYNIIRKDGDKYIIREKNLINFTEDFNIEYDKESDLFKTIQKYYTIK